ncbi:MAG: FMN-binding negative transcriptional regulator [Herminiimonas sp.]|nr:FMN-binding negative transcriptional regulator [Herminiimonas sp.]
MYSPSHFEEKRTEVLHQLIEDHGFGTLVTHDEGLLNANHIPFEIDREAGVLRAHVARANPVWRRTPADGESLVIFQGAHAYITPSWYESKREHGKVVPTWNYMVVHAYGTIRVMDDPAWVLGLVGRLTGRHESGRALPWKVDDAPADYIQKILSAIVGIEIPIGRMIGKWKVSQNRDEADRAGVAAGLVEDGRADNLSMSEAVRLAATR